LTLDPAARQVIQKVSVAPSPPSSGVDFAIDQADDYFLHAIEQTVPLKLIVYPQNETPSKTNSETILVTAYQADTRVGTVVVAEVTTGEQPGGPIDIQEQQIGDVTIPQAEIQVLTIDATAGTYTLSFGGSTTAAINWNDTAATIQTRLQALASIGAGGITVAGSVGGPFTLTFAGALGNQPQALITADPTLLTTGGPGSMSVAHTQVGSGSQNDVQTVTVNADSGVFTLTWGGNTTAQLPENSSADAVATELAALASIGSGNVDVQGPQGGPFVVTFQGALGLAAQAVITYDQTLLTIAGVNEVQTVTVDGTAGTFRLSADAGGHYTAAMAPGVSAATMQTNLQALAAVGANNCQVTADTDLLVYTITFIGALANQPVALLTADASSMTTGTVHVTASTRAQDGSTARTILVGDHVETALVTPGITREVGTLAVVSGTTAETSVLSTPLIIPANTLQNRMVRFAWLGDFMDNSGANHDIPKFRVWLAGSLAIDTSNCGANVNSGDGNGYPVRHVIEMWGNPLGNYVFVHLIGWLQLGTLNVAGSGPFGLGTGKTRTLVATSTTGEVLYHGINSVNPNQAADIAVDLRVIHPNSNAAIRTREWTATLEII
jgi:hypothetical protein